MWELWESWEMWEKREKWEIMGFIDFQRVEKLLGNECGIKGITKVV